MAPFTQALPRDVAARDFATLTGRSFMEGEPASNRREPWNREAGRPECPIIQKSGRFGYACRWGAGGPPPPGGGNCRSSSPDRHKLRGSTLTALRVRDLPWRPGFGPDQSCLQAQNARPVQLFEITTRRGAAEPGSDRPDSNRGSSFFRAAAVPLITSTRPVQARVSPRGSNAWAGSCSYGTHSNVGTKASLNLQRTKTFEQRRQRDCLLGHCQIVEHRDVPLESMSTTHLEMARANEV